MKEGLIYPGGEFKSRAEINRQLEMQDAGFRRLGGDEPKPAGYWLDRFSRRSKEVGQSKQTMEFDFDKTPIINFMSDLHIGAPETDYDRIADELRAIKETPNSYVMFVGDMIDAFLWNPSQLEDMEQVPEQIELMKEIIRDLHDNDRLLGIIPGNHEDWQRRAGVNIYELITPDEVPVQYGVNYITAHVNDIDYRVTMAHQLPGHSMYNHTHPQMREDHFGAEGADIIIGGHTHKKGTSMQYKKLHGGESRPVHYVSLGAYKAQDGFQAKNGRHKLDTEEMGGFAIRLDDTEKNVLVGDIVEINSIS